jgi:hypothetical protein
MHIYSANRKSEMRILCLAVVFFFLQSPAGSKRRTVERQLRWRVPPRSPCPFRRPPTAPPQVPASGNAPDAARGSPRGSSSRRWTSTGTRTASSAAAATAASGRSVPRSTPRPTSYSARGTTSGTPPSDYSAINPPTGVDWLR